MAKPYQYPDRFSVRCTEKFVCAFRSCMHAGEDKGSFRPGFGYTRYHESPRPVCVTNHLHGCPTPVPEPDPEVARCCFRPEYGRCQSRTKIYTCATCGAEAPGWAGKILNRLPSSPGVPCRHENVRQVFPAGWSECPDCQGVWYQAAVTRFMVPTHTQDDLLNAMRVALAPLKQAT